MRDSLITFLNDYEIFEHMKTISKLEFDQNREGYLTMIKSGAIFVYPTDTIYGIGCNALLNPKVKIIRDLKKRPTSPFSLIVPSKEWIFDNCVVSEEAQEWVDKLPGPYTLVLPLKNKDFLSNEICGDSVGVRIPDHWISGLVADLGYPLVTTSVNEAGRQFLTRIEDLEPEFERSIDLFIEEGEIKGKPSKIMRFDTPETKVIER